MTNTTKNGGRQTALNLDGGSFDEAAYRAELIAAGLPAEDAAAVARGLPEGLLEIGHVVVAVSIGRSVREKGAVDDARMVELIDDDDVFAADQTRDDTEVDMEAG